MMNKMGNKRKEKKNKKKFYFNINLSYYLKRITYSYLRIRIIKNFIFWFIKTKCIILLKYCIINLLI